MNKTQIEWAKNPDGNPGYTWNPITGCLNHDDGMCKGGNFPCYAYRLAHGRLKGVYKANKNWDTRTPENYNDYPNVDPFYPRFWPSRLYDPVNKERCWGRQRRVVHTQSPKGIFVCDMSDLFGIGIPEDWTREVLERFQYCPQHRFYLLTKQPQNLVKLSPFPDNCWVGVTATSRRYFNMAIGNLANVKAKVRYISFEPLLERINHDTLPYLQAVLKEGHINWVIIGSQTKPYKPPKIEWVMEIVEAADKAGIPVFLKENLKPLLIDDKGYPHASVQLLDRVIEQGTWKLRQEMPTKQTLCVGAYTLS